MNVRTIKTLAAASMMALGVSTKAAAQSAKTIEKAAQEIVTKDTIKTVKGDVRDARTILLKKYHGHFDGNVKAGKIADGKLVYTEKGRTALPVNREGKIDIAVDAGYLTAKDLPSNAVKVHGSAQQRNNLFDVSGAVANKEGKTDFVAKGSYTRIFPMSENFAFTAKAEAEGVIHRVKGSDSFGVFYPQALGGARFEQKFNNGGRIVVKGEAGVATSIKSKEEIPHDIKSTMMVANAEIEAGMNRTSVYISGGHDAAMGANIGAGVRVKF